MMEVIQRSDLCFQSEWYAAQAALYCGVGKLIENPYAIIKADASRRYSFIQYDEASPVWILTEAMTDQNLCEAISKSFYANFAHRDSVTLITRPQVGAYIATYFSKMKNLSWHIGLKFEAFKITRNMLAYPCANKLFKLHELDNETLMQVVQNVPPENRSQIFKRLYLNADLPVINQDELYVYMVNGQVRGTVSMDVSLGDYAKISDIFLLKPARGQKIGKQIILDACQIAQRKGLIPLLFTERMGGYTRMLLSDQDFEHLGSLDEIVIYR
jgi:GNAT superfamily N-acetyltransferase